MTAQGRYETPINFLATALSGYLLSRETPKPSRYTIRYEGILIGHSVKGTKVETEEDGGPKSGTAAGTFLNSLIPPPKSNECLMIISDRLDEISVYEKGATEKEKIYLLKKDQ